MVYHPASCICRPAPLTAMFQRILVANRGEIALRVIRACRDLGIEVGGRLQRGRPRRPVPRPGRRGHLHRPAGGAPRATSRSRTSSAPPRLANVQAIHPGYGFLSENAHFAESLPRLQHRVHRAAARGDAQARQQERGPQARPEGRRAGRARQRRPDHQRGARRCALARAIGYPGAHQGGGRRRRPRHARGPQRRQPQVGLAVGPPGGRERPSRTAASTWKSTSSSRATSRCRSSADRHGNVVHLWERDCSLAAAPSEAGRGIAGPEPARRGAPGDLRRGRAAGHRRPATRTPAPASSWSTRTTASTSSR